MLLVVGRNYASHLVIGCCGRDRFENPGESLDACLWLVGFMAGEGGQGLGMSVSTDRVRSRSFDLTCDWMALGGQIQREAWLPDRLGPPANQTGELKKCLLVNGGLRFPFYLWSIHHADCYKMCAKFSVKGPPKIKSTPNLIKISHKESLGRGCMPKCRK